MAQAPQDPAEFIPPAPRFSVGAFTWDAERSVLLGPGSYIQSERCAHRLASIQRGTNPVFTTGLELHGNVVTALLVSVQTDYAAWLGQQETLSWFEMAVQS